MSKALLEKRELTASFDRDVESNKINVNPIPSAAFEPAVDIQEGDSDEGSVESERSRASTPPEIEIRVKRDKKPPKIKKVKRVKKKFSGYPTEGLKELQKFVSDQMTNCSVCGIKFASYLFPDHAIASHSTRQPGGFFCNCCSKYISGGTTAFVQHFKEHTSFEGAKQCPNCEKTFYTFKELEKHVDEHAELAIKFTVPHYVCHHCGRQIRFKNNLKWHLINKHSTSGMKCKYRTCGAYYLVEAELKKHEAMHAEKLERDGPPKTVCKICNLRVIKGDKEAYCEQ